jgi:CDP-4-dehydro-6-deoxyglucose reductase, E1
MGAWLTAMLGRLNARAFGLGEAQDRRGLFEIAGLSDLIDRQQGDASSVDALHTALRASGAEIVFHLAGDPRALFSAAQAMPDLRTIVLVGDTSRPANSFGSVRVFNVRADDCIGGDISLDPSLPSVDMRGVRHALDALYGCLLVAERASAQPDLPAAHDFGADASAENQAGWRPTLGAEEALEWDADWRAALARGDDMREITLAQVDACLGQCVRLEPLATDEPDDVDPAALRQQILDLVGAYHAVAHKRTPFDRSRPNAPVSGRVYGARDMQTLVDSALDFWLTTGRFNAEFEQKLARRIGVRHALTVNSGSSANLVAFSALTSQRLKDRRLQPGDEVITCATGFPTTINPILQNNMVPVFVDVDIPTYNVDVAAVQAAIGPRTRAIMVAHTLGNPFDVLAIKALCEKHDLFLIEDCCDALGASVGGRQVGTFGDIGTLSFYPAHHITMGEGGAVFTNNANLNKIMESFRDWGRDCYCDPGADNSCNKRFGWKLGDLPQGYDHKYIYSHLGYNLKITDMQAAVGVAQLDRLDDFIVARRSNFDVLREGLAPLEDILVLPEATKGTEPSWFGFPITLRENAPVDRHAILLGLQAANIGTRLLFGGNLVRQPYMAGRNFRTVGALANADIVVDRTFWVGVYPGLDAGAIDYMIESLHTLCRGARRAVA